MRSIADIPRPTAHLAGFYRYPIRTRHPRVGPLLLLLSALVVAGCGGGDTTTTIRGISPGEVLGNGDPADVKVIQGWVTALDHGDLDAAANYFALPSVAENGPQLVHIRNTDDARQFNASLPCGAHLVRAETAGDFTTATFRLTERPGPGLCGPGTGGLAKTAFVIHDGKIAEWRRVETGGVGGAPGQAV
jgi:hypothetical protein